MDPRCLSSDPEYFVIHKEGTYEEAKQECLRRKARLAVIKNDEEFARARALLRGWEDYWIGMNDTTKEGEFVWSDGSKVNMTW